MINKSIRFSGFVLAGLLIAAPRVQAIPELQLYIEGATYDTGSETWVLTSTSNPIRLWAIGNLTGDGGKGPIYGVKLSLAYDSADSPTFTFTPSTTGGYGGFGDPSTPSAPSYVQTSTLGDSPLLGDGSSLPTHGIYGAGVTWQEFALGARKEVPSQV